MCRILIVENDCVFALILHNYLKKKGYEIAAIVSTGEEAVIKAAQKQVDAVLMDISLSGEMDGIQAAKIIHANKELPILFLSRDKPDEMIYFLQENASCGYLPKPVDPDLLVETLKELLPANKSLPIGRSRLPIP